MIVSGKNLRIFLSLIISLSPFFTSTTGFSQDSNKRLRLVLNWKPEPEFGGFYDAEIEGSYRKFGLNVEILPGASGTPAAQMVAAETVEFGISSAEEILLARSKGADLVAIFAVYQTSPFCILTHPERNFHSLQEIFRSPGILAVRSGMPFFSFLKKKLGEPIPQIVPHLGGVEHFLKQKDYSQQGFISSEPLMAEEKGMKSKTFLLSELGYNPYFTVLMTRRSYFEKNKKEVSDFVQAVREGWKHYLDHPKKANDLMVKLNPSISTFLCTEGAKIQKPLIQTAETSKTKLGVMKTERWNEAAKNLKEAGLISQLPDPNEVFIDL